MFLFRALNEVTCKYFNHIFFFKHATICVRTHTHCNMIISHHSVVYRPLCWPQNTLLKVAAPNTSSIIRRPRSASTSLTHAHTRVHKSLPRLPVPCSKLSAVPICMSGYQRGNSIPFLSCKIHCAEPPPSHPPSPPPPLLLPPPSVYWPGRCKSIPLFIPPKCPFFRCSRKL